VTIAGELKNQITSQEERNRVGGEVGLNLLPLLLGRRMLFQSHFSYRYLQYQGGASYGVPEVGASAAYIPGPGTLLGVALYQRGPSGETPFLFDRIDTQSEAQGLIQGRVSKKITAAALVRYDLEQNRIFDWSYTIGIRGRSLEPRFSYHKLGGQFSFGVHLVGL